MFCFIKRCFVCFMIEFGIRLLVYPLISMCTLRTTFIVYYHWNTHFARANQGCVVLNEDHLKCIWFSSKSNSISIWGSRYLDKFSLSNNYMTSFKTTTCDASCVPSDPQCKLLYSSKWKQSAYISLTFFLWYTINQYHPVPFLTMP